MQIYELIIIIILGLVSLAAIIILTVRNARGKGTCSNGACPSCSLIDGCMEKEKSDSRKISINSK